MFFPARVTALILIVLLLFFMADTPLIQAYVVAVKQGKEIPVLSYVDEEDLLRKKIEAEASKHAIPPIDARVDRVWKLVPGLNGREVDIEATIKRTRKQKRNHPIQWVYRQVKPAVSMDELGAHPIYRGNEQKRAVALMVNVAWGTEHLPGMLKILRQEKVKATFFLDGSWLKKNPDMARTIAKEGHEIGNHAYSHPMMSQLSQARMNEEIGKTNRLIEEILGVKSRWFGPPAGDFDQRVVSVAAAHHMKTVLWTVDTVDWRKSVSPAMMVNKVKTAMGPGHLLLTHPTDRTVKALPQILRTMKEKGYRWEPVGRVLSSERLEPIE
ncbi:polysaccharide deacetylase family protein [Laceyella putida]|uniref:Polysaccharide deacetylase family protein n=1 Tax=Laceyella putida TaxID=110101 RepID=A0ABW2RP86_9BACL